MKTRAVVFTQDDVEALTRALQTLEAERDTSERWGFHSTELEDTIDRVAAMRDRMRAETAGFRSRLARHDRFPIAGVVQGGRS